MLRALFFLCVGVIALPYVAGTAEDYPGSETAEPVALTEVFWAAQTAVSDVMNMCEREPDVCDTSGRVIHSARVAAVNLTGRAHEWLEEGAEESPEQGS